MDPLVDGALTVTLLAIIGVLIANRIGHWNGSILPSYWAGGVVLARLSLDAAGDERFTAHIAPVVLYGVAAAGTLLATVTMTAMWHLWVRKNVFPSPARGPVFPPILLVAIIVLSERSQSHAPQSTVVYLIQIVYFLVGGVAPLFLLLGLLRRATRESKHRAAWDLGTLRVDQSVDGVDGDARLT